MRFSDKVAVVTGGGAGIGRATAEAFAQDGASVVIADWNAELGEQVAQGIRDRGGKALAVKADVSKIADAEHITAEAIRAFGGVDFLCNNAGIQTYGTVIDTDEDTWDRTIDINLKGMYLVAKYCVPEMIKRGGGSVINIASVQGLASQKAVVAYAASKGGIIAMTRTMAVDHAKDKVRVNCICPGSVNTPLLQFAASMSGGDPAAAIQSWGSLHALGRVADAAEIAKVVTFLASDDSSFMTGSAVVVDGGMMAGLE